MKIIFRFHGKSLGVEKKPSVFSPPFETNHHKVSTSCARPSQCLRASSRLCFYNLGDSAHVPRKMVAVKWSCCKGQWSSIKNRVVLRGIPNCGTVRMDSRVLIPSMFLSQLQPVGCCGCWEYRHFNQRRCWEYVVRVSVWVTQLHYSYNPKITHQNYR